ncbi:MAG TPA: glycosyltransferase family 39 protein [Vicinamibacteria bacterium]|nr:glycosyltransferase family 39 protein [Vicinamibacteria bacterium]
MTANGRFESEEARAGEAGSGSGGPTLALLAPAALLAFTSWQFLFRAFLYLRSPFSSEYGEGQVLALVQQVVRDGTLFSDVQRYPMLLSNYPPVFMLLNAPGFRLFGPSLVQPRLLSLLATLALAGLLFALLRRRTGDVWMAASFALLLFAPWFVQTWAATARIDMPAQMFSLAGLYAFDRLGSRRGLRRDLPFLLFGLGFYTRQTTLVAPAAVLGSLLFEPSRRKELPRALAAFALPVLGALLAMDLASRGQAWLHLFPYAAAADYDLARMARCYASFAILSAPLLLLALAGLLLQPGALLRGANLALVLYWLLGLAGLSTIAKEGAAQNYFVEPWLGTLLMAGISLRALAEARDLGRRLWPAGVFLAAAAAILASRGLNHPPQAIRAPERAHAFIALDEAVRANEGPILSENMSVLVLNERRTWVDPWAVMLLAKKGLWDPGTLVGDCRRGLFTLVVTEWRLRQIPGVSECLDDAYEPWQDLGRYQLLRPKRPPGPHEEARVPGGR